MPPRLTSVFLPWVLAPVAEEFIFRGSMLFTFIKQLGFSQNRLGSVSSLLLLRSSVLLRLDFVLLSVLALALTWLYEKTDTLWSRFSRTPSSTRPAWF